MKLGHKITLGVLPVAILFLVASVAQFVHLNNTKDQVDLIVSSNLQELELAEEFFNAIHGFQNSTLHLVLNGSLTAEPVTKTVAEIDKHIGNELNRAQMAIALLEKHARAQIEHGDIDGEQDELREISELNDSLAVLSKLSHEVKALLLAGEKDKAIATLDNNIQPLAVRMHGIISDLEMDAQEEIDKALALVQEKLGGYMIAAALIGIISVISVLGLAIYIMRNITDNVTRLHQATRLLEQGKLDTRIEIASNDELGQIASDINAMAVGLRKTIISRDDLAKEVKARQETEIERQRSEHKFRSIFESSRDTFMILDKTGFLECNDATLHMFECTDREEFLGHHPGELSPETQSDGTPSLEAVNRHIEAALMNGYEMFEWTHRRKSGEEFPAEVLLTRLTLDGKDLLMASVRDITERKHSETELIESEEKFRSITDTVNDALILMDNKATISFWNKKAEAIFGYQFNDAIGKDLHDLIVPARFHDAFHKGFPVFIESGKGEAIGKTLELSGLHKDGHEFPVELSISSLPLKGKWHAVGVIRDITERKRSETKLYEHEKQIRLLLDSTAEAIYGVDIDGNCTMVNKACLSMLGYDNESELLGNNMHRIIHHSHADGTALSEEHCRVYQAYMQGEAAHVDDEVFWRKDASHFPVSYWVHPIYSENSVIGAVVTFLDISEQVSSRSALKQSREQLQSALEGTIAAVSNAVGARDPYTSGHQHRVAGLSAAIAREMGLHETEVKGIFLSATIHDIGKIQLPADILSKPGKLTSAEYQLIKEHPEAGYNILKDVIFSWPVAEVVHQHHERMDGSGYPQGLKGDEICLEARIVAVADVVEAMSSHRPYRPGLGIDAALDEIRTHRGSAFDPDVVDACLHLFEEKRFTL